MKEKWYANGGSDIIAELEEYYQKINGNLYGSDSAVHGRGMLRIWY